MPSLGGGLWRDVASDASRDDLLHELVVLAEDLGPLVVLLLLTLMLHLRGSSRNRVALATSVMRSACCHRSRGVLRCYGATMITDEGRAVNLWQDGARRFKTAGVAGLHRGVRCPRRRYDIVA